MPANLPHFAPVEHVNLIGIVGSLRAGSVNGALARAATGVMPAGSSLTLHSVRDVPLYHGDEEAEFGPPAGAVALHDRIARFEGIMTRSAVISCSGSTRANRDGVIISPASARRGDVAPRE